MAGTKGRVADAAHDCIASFDAIAQVHTPEWEPSTPPSAWSQNEDGRSRFQIWMSNLGAAHSATDRRSADYRLRDAPEVVDRIVELLEELTEINGEALEIISGERSNRRIEEGESETESPSQSETGGQDELSELFLSTGDTLTSLFKVSMLVKQATTRDRYARAASAKDKPYLVEFDMRHVADKFPKARNQPWLLERLGTAITQRRQYLRYCRNHKNRIAHVASSDTATFAQNEDVPRDVLHDGKLELPTYSAHVASTTKTPMTRPTLSPTTASTLQPDKIAEDDLQDLDDRDDEVSQNTSVAYSQANEQDSGHLRVVRLQDLSHDNEPFECPYCFSIVQARRQRSWKKHVLSDLRAYVCMFEDCDAGLFEDKAAWAQHDAEEHRRHWNCQHCQNNCGPFSSPRALHEHMRSVHAGDDLPVEVLTQIVKTSSCPSIETAPDCPLCDFDAEVHQHANMLGQAVPVGSQAVIPLVELQKHLALHQEQLALFAIPPTIERGVESESRHGRSQVDADGQTKMMANWQDHLPGMEATNDPEQLPSSEPDNDFTEGLEEISFNSLDGVHSGETAPAELPKLDIASYKPQEGEVPSILPGDIVYIPRQTGDQLLHNKAVYLGDSGSGQHIARDWDNKIDLEVSLSELVRKNGVTENERTEAESIRSYVVEPRSKPAYYLNNITIPLGLMSNLIMQASKLASGTEWLDGYDRAMVQTTFSAFLREHGTQVLDRSVRVGDIVQMFYTSAKSDLSKDKTSSDSTRTAYVERHAALLTETLIAIIDQVTVRYFPDRDIVSAQLREEQAEMMSRANQALRDAKDQSSGASGEYAGITREDFNEAEISPQSVEALKARLALVIKGEETSVALPKFGAHLMTQTCSSFLPKFHSMCPAWTAMRVEVILSVFHACAKTVIRQDRASSSSESRSVSAERLVALFLSLLISIHAELELERLGGAQPRIRSRLTTVLMKERSRYLSQASEIEERLFRVVQRSKPEFDIHFFTEESRLAHEKRYEGMIGSGTDEPNDLDDPSESKYCYCVRGSHGVMVACDGLNCRRRWFHLSCTDLERPLSKYKTWFCVFCQPPVSNTAEDTPKTAAAAAIVDADDAELELKPARRRSGDLYAGWQYGKEASETAKERPPRGMVCDNCKFVWRSALALELRDCPNCGSYSVFAESRPRTASPEVTDAALRPDATGEEAIGQYFSERTNKFMSLYRRETLAESKSETPREVFPDPWSHLHASPSASSPRPDESPPAVPDDLPPDDEYVSAARVLSSDSSTVQQLKQTLGKIQHAELTLYGGYYSKRSFMSREEFYNIDRELRCVATALRNLLRPQSEDNEYGAKLQSFNGVISALCSSIQSTLRYVESTIATNDTKQWADTLRIMKNVESVSLWERFTLYRNVMEDLFNPPENHDYESVTRLAESEAKVTKLLESQESNSFQAANVLRLLKSHESSDLQADARRSNRQGIMDLPMEGKLQSDLQDQQVEDVQSESWAGHLIPADHDEKEPAISSEPGNATSDSARAAQKEFAVVDAGSADRTATDREAFLSRFPCWVRATYSWGGETKDGLSFAEGDVIEALNPGAGLWWTGRLQHDPRAIGVFPSNFVEVLEDGFQPERTLHPDSEEHQEEESTLSEDFPSARSDDSQAVTSTASPVDHVTRDDFGTAAVQTVPSNLDSERTPVIEMQHAYSARKTLPEMSSRSVPLTGYSRSLISARRGSAMPRSFPADIFNLGDSSESGSESNESVEEERSRYRRKRSRRQQERIRSSQASEDREARYRTAVRSPPPLEPSVHSAVAPSSRDGIDRDRSSWARRASQVAGPSRSREPKPNQQYTVEDSNGRKQIFDTREEAEAEARRLKQEQRLEEMSYLSSERARPDPVAQESTRKQHVVEGSTGRKQIYNTFEEAKAEANRPKQQQLRLEETQAETAAQAEAARIPQP